MHKKISHISLTILALTIGVSFSTDLKKGASTVDLKKDLIAFYPLEGTAIDSSGNGYNGKLNGTSSTEDHFGRPGKAMRFNGDDDNIIIDPPPKLNKNGTTIALWAKFDFSGKNTKFNDVYDGDGPSHPIISQDDGEAIRIFSIKLYKEKKITSAGQGSGHGVGWRENSPDIEAGKWYHIVMTRNGIKHCLYVNGVNVVDPRDEKDVFFTCACSPMQIGSIGAWGGQKARFCGSLDDIRIYSRVFTSEEVKAIYLEKP